MQWLSKRPQDAKELEAKRCFLRCTTRELALAALLLHDIEDDPELGDTAIACRHLFSEELRRRASVD